MTPEAPVTEPAPKPRVPRAAVFALVLAALLLIGGAVVAWLGTRAASDADREEASAAQQLTSARSALQRAQADLAAARAAISTFDQSSRAAIAASSRVIDVESRLVDHLNRLRQAGEAESYGTYNQLVNELNSVVDELNAATLALAPPLRDFSDALDELPTARCTGPAAKTLKWTDYGGNGLQCARLVVPLDYNALGTAQIEITVVKRPADDPGSSLGPLVLNPGGPGVSGIAFMRDAILLLPPELLRRFDLIAFDPRGVGRSSPVDCADNLDPLFDADLTAPSPRKRNAAVDAVERVVRGCSERTGALLRHVDTISTARDMDRLREALGVDQLSYLGYSYGTYLGAVYADLFPKRVRAAVLDGGVDPRRATSTSVTDESQGFRDALEAALDDCRLHPECAFYSAGHPLTGYDDLMKHLAEQPLAVGTRRLGRTRAEIAVVSGLYPGADGWPKLMSALASAAAGDGRPLLALGDQYTGRRPDGSYNNEFEAHYAINCTDFEGRKTPRQARDEVLQLSNDPDRLKVVGLALDLPCAFWPAPVHEPPAELHAKGAAPIVVIGGEHDPATPIEGSEALARALDSATLLRWEGTGHTAFGRGNRCIDDAVVAYLVDLEVPASNTSCPAE
ncbi:MAG: alpha/beta hydrolase [Acidimicrobiia bacterium]